MTLVNNNDDYTRQSLKHNEHKEETNQDASNKKFLSILEKYKIFLWESEVVSFSERT
jgi:hypothetical protein